MPIKKWHIGKIIILWVWGILLVTLCYSQAISKEMPPFPGILYVIGIFVIPVALSVVTWRWFGGREK